MRLIIEDLEGSTTVVNLESEEVTIGRKPHNTIQLTEQNVSRSHARLNFHDDGWSIHDLGSYNGVKVNGVPITQPTVLRESDLIQIGDYHLTLTDNADRAAIDFERPRPAANDGLTMSSSANLPSVSVEDLEPMAPLPAASAPAGVDVEYADEPDDNNKQNKIGIIIGVIGMILAVIGIGMFVASQGGDDNPREVASKGDEPNPTAGPDEPPTTDSAGVQPAGDADGGTEPVPEADSGAEPVPEADTGEQPVPEADGGAEPVPEVDTGEEPVPVPDPEPDPEPTKKKKKKIVKPKLPPDEALAAARKASLQGDNRKAYGLAKDAYSQNQSGDALNLMGVAACKMGSESKAKAAHRKMSSQAKSTLEKICGPLGIQL